MNNKYGDLFINMLIKETYKFMPQGEASQSNSCLEDYFVECEKNLKQVKGDILLFNFLENNCHAVHPVSFYHKTSCYRTTIGKNLLDFPSSWGEFAFLTKSLKEDQNLFVEVINEDTGLRDIFLSIDKTGQKDRHYFLINYKADYYLVSVDNCDFEYFSDWMIKYMGVDQDLPLKNSDAA